jgi:phage terminase large subunit-like protein
VTSIHEALSEVDAALARREQNESLADEAERLSLSFREFVYAAWPVLGFRSLVPTWHIDALTDHYQAAIERWITRLIITIPPGYLKSTVFSVLGPAWAWTRRPGEQFVSASHSDDLATRDTRRSRAVMQSPWYQARWGDVFSFSSDENLKTRYSNDEGGHRIRTHVGGGTGDRGSVLQLDDPHNAQEAHSEVMMQSAKAWWGETWASRLDDAVGDLGVKMVIGQRISEDDLIGHLLANDEDAGRWTHLCLPLRWSRKHPFCYPPEKVVAGRKLQGDPRTKEDELLAPAYQDEARVADRLSDMSARTIAAQFQQLPAPSEGLLLKRANWRYYDRELTFYAERTVFGEAQVRELASRIGHFQLICNSWDTSVKDREHSDYVSGQTWGCIGAHRYLLRLYWARAGLNATIEAMLELAYWGQALWPHCPHYTVIENSANGPDAARTIRSKIQGVTVADAKGSKEVRADAASPALDGFNCYLPGYALADGSSYDPARTPTEVQNFVEELAVFNGGTHDDQVDAWSSMILWTRDRSGGAVMSVPQGQATPPRHRGEEHESTRLRPAMR